MTTYNDVNIVGHFVDLKNYPTTGELVLQIGDGTAIPLPIGPPGPKITSVAQTAGRFVFNLADGTSIDGGPVPAFQSPIGYDTDGVPVLLIGA